MNLSGGAVSFSRTFSAGITCTSISFFGTWCTPGEPVGLFSCGGVWFVIVEQFLLWTSYHWCVVLSISFCYPQKNVTWWDKVVYTGM